MEINKNLEVKQNNESINKETFLHKIIFVGFIVIYTLLIIYGIISVFNPNYDSAQAKLICLSGVSGLLLTFAFPLLKIIFGIKTSSFIQVTIHSLGFLALVLGEGFCLYYKISWRDTFLHFYSGLLFSIIGAILISALFNKENIKHKTLIVIIGGVLISLSIGFIWEIFEFTIDSFFCTNMQKSIPEIDDIFNGGDTSLPLNGSNDIIADFYKTPSGYRYALLDTMEDIICCFTGSLLFIVLSFALLKFIPNLFDNSIEFTNNNIITRVKKHKQKNND